MYVDRVKGVGNLLDDLKKSFTSGVGQEILTSDASKDILQQKLSEANAGKIIGKQIGCGVASAFNDAVPKALWGGDSAKKMCADPDKGGIKVIGTPNPYAKFAMEVIQPSLRIAKMEAGKYAEPAIKERLMPWFIGLPIAGLLVGAGVTYLIMNRTRPKR